MSSASDPKSVVTGYPAAPKPPPAGGAGYPNSAPPPPSGGSAYPTAPHYPNGEAPSPDFECSPARVRLLLALSFAALVLLTGLIGLLCQIDSPFFRISLPAFAVSSASVSAFNLSFPEHLLSSDFDISLSVRNPNDEQGIYYESFAAAVFYGSYDIAETSFPPFYQDKGSGTTVRARIVAAGEYVEDDVAKGITADRGSGDGVVNFNVRVFAWVRFVGGEPHGERERGMMSVYCEDVPIGFKNGTATVGSLVGSPKQCTSFLTSFLNDAYGRW